MQGSALQLEFHLYNIINEAFLRNRVTKIPKRTLNHKSITVPVFLSSCSPKEITGIAEAKNIYVVGARILYQTTSKLNV